MYDESPLGFAKTIGLVHREGTSSNTKDKWVSVHCICGHFNEFPIVDWEKEEKIRFQCEKCKNIIVKRHARDKYHSVYNQITCNFRDYKP